jgi:hypothetical protein
MFRKKLIGKFLCWYFHVDSIESASEELKAKNWDQTVPQNTAKPQQSLALPAQLPSGADLPSCTGTFLLWLEHICVLLNYY